MTTATRFPQPSSRWTLRGLAAWLAAGGALLAAAPPSIHATAPQPALEAGFPAALVRTALLTPGKTLGDFHLKGLVKADGSVQLRWANSSGEMATEGVVISRQKVGETAWKELNPKAPVGFFLGANLKTRLKRMRPDRREELMAFFYGDIQHHPGSGRRMVEVPEGGVRSAADLTPEGVAGQYRAMRNAGKLAVANLQLLHAKADLDGDTAELLGLGYVDKPPRGSYRYRIVVKLPEGGSAVAVTPEPLDGAVPTLVPTAVNLSARSGNGTVLLDWEAPKSDVITGYNLYRAESPAGPFVRLNRDPVKKVMLESEDPELVARRGMARQAWLQRESRKLDRAALTPERRLDLRLQAEEAVRSGAELPALPEAQAKAIRSAVSSGRLLPGGMSKALSAYTDSIRAQDNAGFQNEKTYHYKVTSVDIGGGETALAAAPVIAGTPKDLEPPAVPARPLLAAEAAAQAQLNKSRTLRAQNPGLLEADHAVQAKLPQTAPPPALAATLANPAAAAPVAAHAADTRPALAPEVAALSLADARKLRFERNLATLPVKELAAVAQASVLRSRPDGSAPPADLVWPAVAAPDLKEYVVYRSQGKGAPARLGASATAAWLDSTLEVGQAYRYSVASVDRLGNESGRSGESAVQVRDSALKAKLAIKRQNGKGAASAGADGPARSFVRPPGMRMAVSDLSHIKGRKASPVQLASLAGDPIPVLFQAPKEPVRAALAHPNLLKAPRPAPPLAALVATQAEPATLKAAPALAMATRAIQRSFNPMLALLPAQPREVFAVLDWDPPLHGAQLDYLVYQAPQKTEIKRDPRPPMTPVTASLGLRPEAGAAPAAAMPKLNLAAGRNAAAVQSDLAGLIQSSPERHLQARSGVALSAARGTLAVAAARRDTSARFATVTGPGAFALISEAPVQGERFVVRFPAETAQYGGATFYYRIQARTREFEQLVAGEPGEILEVRLPDLVPPPVPTVGAIDLRQGGPDQLNAVLTWGATPVPDLAGYFVDRQAMNHHLVDGVPEPTSPAGDPQRMTGSPVAAPTWTDFKVAGGFFRYTIRSVDQTGNVSAARGQLDLFVPGEPRPGAPTGLVLAAGRLSWKGAGETAGFTVWRSFTGEGGDFECVSPILGGLETGYTLPAGMKGQFRVVARSASGLQQTASEAVR